MAKTSQHSQPDPVSESPAGQPDAADQRLTFLLCRVYSKMVDVAAPFHRKKGISMHASQVIMGLLEHGPQPVGDLARLIAVDLSTVSHVLRRLDAQGLVARVRDGKDNRVVTAALTDSGEALAKQCRLLTIEHEQLMLQSMTPDERATIKRLLSRIYDNELAGEAEGKFMRKILDR